MKILHSEDIFIQNDFIDELTDNPYNVLNYIKNSDNSVYDSFDILFDVALRSIKGNKIFDFLLLQNASCGINELNTLIDNMLEEGVYYSYISDVIDRNDRFLLGYIYTYIGEPDVTELFDSKLEVAMALADEGNYKLTDRLNSLCELSNLNPDEETVNYIKESIARLINNDRVLNRVRSAEERKEDIEYYQSLVDRHVKKKFM